MPKRAKVSGVKSSAERGPIGAWATEARQDADLSVPAVVERLARSGVRVSEATIRGIEGGSKKPGRRLLRELAAVYRARPPGDEGESSDRGGSAAPDLVAALEAQTAAITKLAGAIESERQERLAWETGLLEAIRDLVAAARTGAAQ